MILEGEEGRRLRFRFFQELGQGATVEEIKDIFIQNLFSQEAATDVTAAASGSETRPSEKSLSLAERARLHIEEHYGDRLSLQTIASQLSVCKEHLSRAFKKERGCTVTEHIHTVRIDLAKNMILEDQLSLKEICYELGYQSYNDFYRNFRKLTGISPREFQENLSK